MEKAEIARRRMAASAVCGIVAAVSLFCGVVLHRQHEMLVRYFPKVLYSRLGGLADFAVHVYWWPYALSGITVLAWALAWVRRSNGAVIERTCVVVAAVGMVLMLLTCVGLGMALTPLTPYR